MAKHTPGPWTISELGICGPSEQVLRPVQGRVYDEYDSDPATIEIPNDANAQLIKAAPELLAACKIARNAILALCEVRSLPSGWQTLVLDPIQAAINKAEPPTSQEQRNGS